MDAASHVSGTALPRALYPLQPKSKRREEKRGGGAVGDLCLRPAASLPPSGARGGASWHSSTGAAVPLRTRVLDKLRPTTKVLVAVAKKQESIASNKILQR